METRLALHNISVMTKAVSAVSFNRKELNSILKIYGQMVANGEWRDYSISSFSHRAVFSIYRATSEIPIYCIVKAKKKSVRVINYSIITMNGQIINNGYSLDPLLRVFNKRHLRLI